MIHKKHTRRVQVTCLIAGGMAVTADMQVGICVMLTDLTCSEQGGMTAWR